MIFIPLIDIHQTHDQGFCLILFVTHVEQPDVEIILFSQKGELHISPKRKKNKTVSDAGIHPTYAHSTKKPNFRLRHETKMTRRIRRHKGERS